MERHIEAKQEFEKQKAIAIARSHGIEMTDEGVTTTNAHFRQRQAGKIDALQFMPPSFRRKKTKRANKDANDKRHIRKKIAKQSRKKNR